MTIKELIVELEKYPETAEVLGINWDSFGNSYYGFNSVNHYDELRNDGETVCNVVVID